MARWSVALVAVLGAALVASSVADEFTSPHIKHLTASNFEETVGGGRAGWSLDALLPQQQINISRPAPVPPPPPAGQRRQGVLYQVLRPLVRGPDQLETKGDCV